MRKGPQDKDAQQGSSSQPQGVEPLVTQAVAARAVGLPPSTLRRMVRLGHIPSVEIAGTRRVRLSAVRSVMRERPATLSPR
jgi:hypothetical protein